MKAAAKKSPCGSNAGAAGYPSLKLFKPQPVAPLAEAGVAPISPTPSAKLDSSEIMQTVSAQLTAPDDLAIGQPLVAQLPWSHHRAIRRETKDKMSAALLVPVAAEVTRLNLISDFQLEPPHVGCYQRKGGVEK